MNEWQKLGSGDGRLNVRDWVLAAVAYQGKLRNLRVASRARDQTFVRGRNRAASLRLTGSS